MSDNTSHEFIPPVDEDLTELIEADECFSCGEILKTNAPASCPECGEAWCYDCIDDHAKEHPAHFQTS